VQDVSYIKPENLPAASNFQLALQMQTHVWSVCVSSDCGLPLI
jgi:hypothetical protein